METGELINTLSGHSGSTYSVAISSDNKYIISGSFDNTIKIWDMEKKELIYTLTGHTSSVCSITIS